MINTLIIHGGRSVHFDEVLVASLATQIFPQLNIIKRKNPSKEEMEDPTICIADVGGEYNPSKLHFDHHQVEFKGKEECAYTLFSRHFDLEKTFSLFDWYSLYAVLDNMGPSALEKQLGCPQGVIPKIQNPIVTSLFSIIAEKEEIKRRETTFSLLKLIGKDIMETANQLYERVGRLRVSSYITSSKGVAGLVIHKIPPEENPVFGVQTFLKITNNEHVGFCISNEIGREGVEINVLYRFNDNPHIDFNKIKDNPNIGFVHNNGFIAKTNKVLSFEECLALVKESTLWL